VFLFRTQTKLSMRPTSISNFVSPAFCRHARLNWAHIGPCKLLNATVWASRTCCNASPLAFASLHRPVVRRRSSLSLTITLYYVNTLLACYRDSGHRQTHDLYIVYCNYAQCTVTLSIAWRPIANQRWTIFSLCKVVGLYIKFRHLNIVKIN